MDRTTTVKLARSLLLAAPAVLALSACAARKPVAEVARAEQAVRHAETTSEADRYAPTELNSAQVKLARARRAIDAGNYDAARRLAEQALADAQLAESKAESKVARDQAARTRADIEVLQTETLTPSTVVIERQRIAPPSSTVIVEHSTPPVIVERPVPAKVIVERPAPAQVIVERAAPPPASVVIQRDVPVEVIPE